MTTRIPGPTTTKKPSQPLCIRMGLLASALCAMGFQSLALAAGASELVALQTVDVIGQSPIDSIGVALSQFPANAQKITALEANAQGASNLADLLNNAAGSVSLSNGSGSPYQNDVNYRGFQASSLLGAPVGLSVYFDGVRMNEPFGSIVNWDLIPMNAMSSVDVLPGSNPVFGLNTLGAALVVNTKNGKDNPGTSITALGGSFQRKAVRFESGWVDQAHATDYFFAGNIDRQAGYRAHSSSDVKQFFGKARWQGNSGKTQIELSTALSDTTLKGTQSLPMDMMANPSSAYTWPDSTSNRMFLANLKGSHWISDEQQLAGNLYVRRVNTAGANSNAQLDDGCTNADGSLVMSGSVAKCASKAPNGTAVNSVTSPAALGLGFGRWTSSINTSLVNSATRQNSWGANIQWSRFEQLLGHDNTLIAGGSLDSAHIIYDQASTLAKLVNYQAVVIPNQEYGFTANGLAPSASNPVAFSGSNVLGSVNLSSTTYNFSTYLSNTLKYTERLSLMASGSLNVSILNQSGVNSQFLNGDGGYSWTDSSTGISYYNPAYTSAYQYANATASGAKATANGVPTGSVAGPESNSLSGNHRFQRFNPAFGFNYNLDPFTGVYGNYSEAMRAPTSIELSCANPNSPCALPTGFNGDPDLKPVVAKTIEFGGRGQWGQSTRWNAAIFDSRLSNDIQFIATSSSLGYFSNVGTTERRGFEAGVKTQVSALSFSANYGFVDARYQTAFTTASGQNVTRGDKIPGIARQTLKLRAVYPVNPDWVLGSTLILASSQWAHGNESNQDPRGVVPGYGVLNLDAHFKINDELQLHANVSNALNRQYATYGLAGTRSVYSLATQNFLTPAAPRALWISLTYTFGGKTASVKKE